MEHRFFVFESPFTDRAGFRDCLCSILRKGLRLFIDPDKNFGLLLTGFVAAILGGWGSSAGAVIGGLVLGIIQSVFAGVLPAGWQDGIAFVILILLLYFRPQGLLGTTMTEGEM